MRTILSSALLLATVVSPAAAQQKPESDFDYLLGDWVFEANDQQYGKYGGRWSAIKLVEGQILDEYRVLDPDGGTIYVTTTLRNYNEKAQRWELIGADAGQGLQDFGTARRIGDEVHIEQRFGVTAGRPSLWRIRYYNIKDDSFSWSADRSMDDGKTWTVGYMHIEARRVGAARTLPALTGASSASSASPN